MTIEYDSLRRRVLCEMLIDCHSRHPFGCDECRVAAEKILNRLLGATLADYIGSRYP